MNGIDSEGAKFIAKNLIILTKLSIHHNIIGPEGAKFIANMINLIHLDINHNKIGPVGSQAICDLTKWCSLNISDNDNEGANVIAEIMSI